MAYGFNEDKSKAQVYTQAETDAAFAQEAAARIAVNNRVSNILDNQNLNPNKDSELVDIRTGYDGHVHASAGDAVRKGNSDFDKIARLELGVKIADFTVTANVDHLSTEDRVYFPVSAGDKIVLVCEKEADCIIELYDENGSVAHYPQSYSGVAWEITCPNASSTLGFYINSSVSQNIRVKIMNIDSNISFMEKYQNDLKLCRKGLTFFKTMAGSNHSASNDKIALDISLGEMYRVKVVASTNVSVGLRAGPSGGSATQYTGSITKDKWVYFKATSNIEVIGFSTNAPAGSDVYIEAVVEVVEDYQHFKYDDFVSANFPKNLIGKISGKLYKTPMLHTGDKVTFSTASGQAIGTNVTISFYDKDKTLLNTYVLRTMDTDGVRTVALASAFDGACYISRSNCYEDIQVEIGDAATAYETYKETDFIHAMEDTFLLESIILAHNSYKITSGSTHSSAKDRVYVDIKQGDVFYVLAETVDNAVSYFTLYDQSANDGSFYPNKLTKFTAPRDITSLGLYNPASTVTDTVDFYIINGRSPIAYDEIQYDFVNSTAKAVSIDSAIGSFSDDVAVGNDIEQFLFFTDPHIFPHAIDEAGMELAIGLIEKTYNNSPASFVLCGGDWLQSNDTKSEAAYKLGRIDAIMRAKFGERYYPILGNHDTNYQGASHQQTPYDFTDKISNEGLKNLWFREYGSNYYEFIAPNKTRFYVFDTQLDWYVDMDSYKWEQSQWFASELIQNDDDHSVISLHIIKNYADENVLPFPEELTLIAQAYNARNTISVNGVSYNFGNCSGKVALMIGGHLHSDLDGETNDIPWIITTNTTYTPRFDLCVIDYDDAKFRTYRVGDGSNREINIVV